MTAQGLADRCAALGHPLDRSVIAKLERGHRNTITVPDLLALAKALGVPPVLLVLPLGRELEADALPGQRRPTWELVKWFGGRGAFPAPDPDPRPSAGNGTPEDNQAYLASAVPLLHHDEHDRLVLDWLWEQGRVDILEEAAAAATTEQERSAHQGRLGDVRRRLGDLERLIADLRTRMRGDGVLPPRLPVVLATLIGEPAAGADAG